MSINKDDNSSASTVPCQNKGCTFWGRPATEGFCSKCYNEKMKERNAAAPSSSSSQQQQLATSAASASLKAFDSAASIGSSVTTDSSSSSAGVAAAASSSSILAAPLSTPTRKVQESRSRCFACNKKVGLTGIECKCGYVFCGAHRYPDTHTCDFDFKKHDRDILAKSSEKVVASKLADKL